MPADYHRRNEIRHSRQQDAMAKRAADESRRQERVVRRDIARAARREDREIMTGTLSAHLSCVTYFY
jgi:hypothetical protein